MTRLQDVKVADMLVVLPDLVKAEGAHFEAYQIAPQVADKTGVGDSYNTSPGHDFRLQREREGFYARVRRALDKMAEDGRLKRVGRSQQRPDGGYNGNEVYYYTPAAYQAAADQKDQDDRVARLTARRWNGIRADLHAHGFDLLDDALTLDDWERLLSLIGWRAGA
jgi:hypothetical protein